MADINQVITVGIGTPSDIEHLILVGLNANPNVAIYYQPTIRAEFLPAVLTHEVDTHVQLMDLNAPPLGITVNIEYTGHSVLFHDGSNLTFHDGSHVVFHNIVATTPSLFEV